MSSPTLRGLRSREPDKPSGSGKFGAKPAVSEEILAQVRAKLEDAKASRRFKSFDAVFAAADKADTGKVTRAQFEDGLRELKVRARRPLQSLKSRLGR